MRGADYALGLRLSDSRGRSNSVVKASFSHFLTERSRALVLRFGAGQLGVLIITSIARRRNRESEVW